MIHNNNSITDQVYLHLEVQERGRIGPRIHANSVMKPDSELAAFIQKPGKENIQDAVRLIANKLVSL
jgi:hypothetical protein